MKTINQEELFGLLAAIEFPQPIGLTTLTKVNVRKTGNKFGDIYKLNKTNCFVGGKYENMVNNALIREGRVPGFEVGERSWGGKITPCLVAKGDKTYLAAQVLKSSPTFLYRKNGILTIINKKEIEDILPPENKELVKYRNFTLDNIVGVNLGGEQYKVRITNKISTHKPTLKKIKKPVLKIKSIKKNYKKQSIDDMIDEVFNDPSNHTDDLHGDNGPFFR